MNAGKMKIKIMRFGDMKPGTHFVDGHDRKFIKLKLDSAMGRPFLAVRHWDGESCSLLDNFNAVDYQGIGGKCPDWVVFEIIKTPA